MKKQKDALDYTRSILSAFKKSIRLKQHAFLDAYFQIKDEKLNESSLDEDWCEELQDLCELYHQIRLRQK